MLRIRRVFLVLTLVLAVPLGLLLREVFATAAEERVRARQTVAQRLVDTVEQQLSTWLAREEDRPYGHYRYLFLPESDTTGQAFERSPLSDPPSEPFVVGYFQIEPDGSVTSPRWPRNPALAQQRSGSVPDPEGETALAEVAQQVGGLWQTSSEGFPELGLDLTTTRYSDYSVTGGLTQGAGTTIPLDPRSQAVLGKQENPAEPQGSRDEAADDESALDVLDQLNRAAYDRRQRPSKQAQSQLQNVASFNLEPVETSPRALSNRDAYRSDLASVAETEQLLDALEADAASETEATVAAEADDTTLDDTALDDTALVEAVEVRYEPMLGRDLGDGRLVLYRTVVLGEQGYRQGLVLDSRALLDWLNTRALAGLAAEDRVQLLPDSPSPNLPAGIHAFRHRFAEPFEGLSMLILLDPLSDPGGRQLTTLAVLLTLALAVAWIALYRMVAVVVGFSERRNNFVSAVSHELKTPLTAIRMHGEMLRDGMVASDDHRQRYYETLTAEAERLTRLVNNVLELSRLERRDRPMQLVAGPVDPVLEEVSRVLRPHVEKQGFSLHLETDDDLPAVRFDRDALVQVLFNLIDNALKYARDTEPAEIVLHARRHHDGVALAVRDHGPGVDRRILEKIFEPFYRGENEMTRRAKGTGIGLSLVRGLVERMGGTVVGHNCPEGGFEVTVALPSSA